MLAEGSRYRIAEQLGAGAMGEVWRAYDQARGGEVVVKIMLAKLSAGLADRLRLECQALAKIDHPNVVRVFDSGTTGDGRPFLVMEYLVGRTLDVVVQGRGALPVAEVVQIGRQIVAALGHVHELGFVHRDVKPANVFLCDDGTVKLLDFGVIKLVEQVTGVAPLQVPTQHGAAIGTPSFMAPEQATARTVDGRADLYGAGLILYILLTGRHPFAHHRQLKDMLLAHVCEVPPAPSQVASQAIPAELDRLVMAALAKKPEERIRAADLIRELTLLTGAQPSQPTVAPAMVVRSDEVARYPLRETTPFPPLAAPTVAPGPATPWDSSPSAPGYYPQRSGEFDATAPPVASAPAPPSPWRRTGVLVTFWLSTAIGFAAGLAVLSRFLG